MLIDDVVEVDGEFVSGKSSSAMGGAVEGGCSAML